MNLSNMTIFQIFGAVVAGYGLWEFLKAIKQGSVKENIPKLIIYCVVAAFAADLNQMVGIGQKIITTANSLLDCIKFKA